MFSYNSSTWVPRTTKDHAIDILNDINNTLKANSLPTLTGIIKNIIWIFILAVAGMRSALDIILFNAQSSFNPSECSDDQITSLLPIVGTSLQTGTYTTVDVTITASNTGSAVIPSGSTMILTNDISFSTQEANTIPATQTATLTLIANIRGPVVVITNQLTQFSTTIPNISTITNAASIEGVADETVLQVRQRIITGAILPDLDEITRELRGLQGITDAVVYFNPDSTVPLVLTGGLSIATRTAQILIIGTSTLIATTFWKTLLKTQGGTTQNYITLSGQAFPVKYDTATDQTIYVNVYIPSDASISSSTDIAIKNLVLTLQPSLKIGNPVTSAMIDQLFTTFTGATIVGSDVSLDNINFYKEVLIDATSRASIVFANIDIVNL
jgi:hypothetical protein